ncbi:MAG TPA: DUF995 domain-containing protein [Ancylobacter sp.]
MNKSQLFLTALAFSASLAVVPYEAAGAQSVTPADAASAAPLTSSELYQLYSNKSWVWPDGSGYFSSNQRRFIAVAGTGSTASYAVGRWFLSHPGKLCFRARWYARIGHGMDTTCFSHRVKDGVVFQKREPDGVWYVFKHASTNNSDEYAKLRRGDYVSAGFPKAEAQRLLGK